MSVTEQTIVSLEEEIPPEKMEIYLQGKELKEAGDKAFKFDEDPQAALVNYHKVLLHWKGLNRQNPVAGGVQGDSKPKSQLDEELEKVYSNMSACYITQKRYDRAIETANQALALNKDNFKALFRKAKAFGEQGFFEKAEPILNELLTKNPAVIGWPEAPTIKAVLDSLRAKDKERERKANKKLRGFLNSTKEIFDAESSPTLESATDADVSSSAKIEEVKDE